MNKKIGLPDGQIERKSIRTSLSQFEDSSPADAALRRDADLVPRVLNPPPHSGSETKRPATPKPTDSASPTTPKSPGETQEKRAGDVHQTPGKSVSPGDSHPTPTPQSGARQDVQPNSSSTRPGTVSTGDLLTRALNATPESLAKGATSPEVNQGSPIIRPKTETGVSPVESGFPKPADVPQRQSLAFPQQSSIPVEKGVTVAPNQSAASKVVEPFSVGQPSKAEPAIRAQMPPGEFGAVKPEVAATKPEIAHPVLNSAAENIKSDPGAKPERQPSTYQVSENPHSPSPVSQKLEGFPAKEVISNNAQPSRLNDQGPVQGIQPGVGTAFDTRKPETVGFKSSPGEKDGGMPAGRSDIRDAKIEDPTWKSGTEKLTGVSGSGIGGTIGTGVKDLSPKDLNPKDLGSKDSGPKDLGPKDLGPKSPTGKDLGPKPQGGRFGDMPNIFNLGDKTSGIKGLGARLQALELGFGKKDKAEPNTKSRPVEAPLRINGVPVRAELGGGKGGKLIDGQSSRADGSKGQGGRRFEPSEFVVRSDKKNQGQPGRFDDKSQVDKGASRNQGQPGRFDDKSQVDKGASKNQGQPGRFDDKSQVDKGISKNQGQPGRFDDKSQVDKGASKNQGQPGRFDDKSQVDKGASKNQGQSGRFDGKTPVDNTSSKSQPGDRLPPPGDRNLPVGGKVPGVMQGMVDSVKENIKSGLRSVLTNSDIRKTEIATGDKSQGSRVRTGRTESCEPPLKGVKDGDKQIFSSQTRIPPLKQQMDTRSLIPVLMPAGPAGIAVLKDFGRAPKAKESDGGSGVKNDRSAGSKPGDSLATKAPKISDVDKGSKVIKPDGDKGSSGGAGRPFIRLHLPDGTYGGFSLAGKGKVGNFVNSEAQDAPTRRNTVITPKQDGRAGEASGAKTGKSELSPVTANDSKVPGKEISNSGKVDMSPVTANDSKVPGKEISNSGKVDMSPVTASDSKVPVRGISLSGKSESPPATVSDSKVPGKEISISGKGEMPPASKDSNIAGKEPSIPLKDVTASGKSELPASINSKVPDKESSIPGKESSIPGKESLIPGKEPSIPGKESLTPAKDPSVPVKDSSIPGRDSLVPEKTSKPTGDLSDSFGKPYLAGKGEVPSVPAVLKGEVLGEVEIVFDEGDTVVSKIEGEGSAHSLPGPEGRLPGASAEQSKPKLTEAETAAERRRRRYINEDFESQEVTWSIADEEESASHFDPMRRYVYIVKPGDTVESVAAQVLEDPALAPLLYRKNKQFVLAELDYGVHPLQPGVEIELPTPSEIATFRMSGR